MSSQTVYNQNNIDFLKRLNSQNISTEEIIDHFILLCQQQNIRTMQFLIDQNLVHELVLNYCIKLCVNRGLAGSLIFLSKYIDKNFLESRFSQNCGQKNCSIRFAHGRNRAVELGLPDLRAAK